MSSVHGLYSTWTAWMGWTAKARRSVDEETSERPTYLTFPRLRCCRQQTRLLLAV